MEAAAASPLFTHIGEGETQRRRGLATAIRASCTHARSSALPQALAQGQGQFVTYPPPSPRTKPSQAPSICSQKACRYFQPSSLPCLGNKDLGHSHSPWSGFATATGGLTQLSHGQITHRHPLPSRAGEIQAFLQTTVKRSHKPQQPSSDCGVT